MFTEQSAGLAMRLAMLPVHKKPRWGTYVEVIHQDSSNSGLTSAQKRIADPIASSAKAKIRKDKSQSHRLNKAHLGER